VESDSGKPPVARLLTAGARGADRVAHAAGVDRALDQAVEEAIVRALRSPGIRRAIERAIVDAATSTEPGSDEIALVVRQALNSEAADQIWAEVLASEQAQMLVERIATAPEVRAAIAAQGAGLITDIGIRLTKITEALDDAMERVVRNESETETNQAGLATRAVAGGIDVALLVGFFSVASSVIASVIPFTFGGKLSLVVAIALGVLGFVVGGGIIVAFWALAGQTPGMRFLSIRLVHQGSRQIPFPVAVRRLFGVLLSLLALGLGFLAILRDPSRRAWHDRMTGTEVIYDTLARSARHAIAAAGAVR
jgi:uncharacterized RDD family membrane protein YckC